MDNLTGCQIPCIGCLFEEEPLVETESLSFIVRFKRTFAKPWNTYVKNWLRKGYNKAVKIFPGIQNEEGRSLLNEIAKSDTKLKAGDWVRVRPREEIEIMLNPWAELKGCAFLDSMWDYCGTEQRVLQVVERFLDERDYKVKKAKGVVLLENIFCLGTPAFGRCDRSCYLFWRVEWLEKIEKEQITI